MRLSKFSKDFLIFHVLPVAMEQWLGYVNYILFPTVTASPGFEFGSFLPCVDPPCRHWSVCSLWNMLSVSPAVHSLPLIPTVDCHSSIIACQISMCYLTDSPVLSMR